jgi:putative transposase
VVEQTMDVAGWVRKQLEDAHPDLLRAMVQEMAEALMGAEADALCGAGYGERSLERVNRRNGYRERDWDTRVGSIELAIPKLREGSYFPEWLLQPRRRAEQAFVSVIADAYLAGVSTGASRSWCSSSASSGSRRARSRGRRRASMRSSRTSAPGRSTALPTRR